MIKCILYKLAFFLIQFEIWSNKVHMKKYALVFEEIKIIIITTILQVNKKIIILLIRKKNIHVFYVIMMITREYITDYITDT